MAKNDPAEQWAALNARQRTYLQAAYDADQAEEAYRRQRAANGFTFDRTPASEWRWQMYGPAETALYATLRSEGLVDNGTGATWAALETRKLVLLRHSTGLLGEPLLEVQMTALGRKVVRAGTGEERPKAAPKGQLRPRQWAALAKIYQAGAAGVRGHDLSEFDWWHTLRRLNEYTPRRLTATTSAIHPDARTVITVAGWHFYAAHWEIYRKLYPDVESPPPDPGPTPLLPD